MTLAFHLHSKRTGHYDRAAVPGVAVFVLGLSLGAVDARAQCAPAVQRLITDRKFDEARATLQAQLNRAPNDDAVMDCMGRLRLDEGAPGEAVDWLEKAVKINPKSAQHHLWLGNAVGADARNANKLRQPGLARRMRTEYEQAVALDGTLADAHHGLFLFYSNAPGFMGGSIDKARQEAAVILKLNPMRGHLDYAALAEQNKDYAGAEKEFLAAIAAVMADTGTPYNATGAFYRRRQRWAEAIAMYEKSLKAAPDARNSSIAHYGLGLVHQQAGRPDQARTELQIALVANPKNEDAKKALASLK
jgi:tetratricopeptide (TPR) repeat protein